MFSTAGVSAELGFGEGSPIFAAFDPHLSRSLNEEPSSLSIGWVEAGGHIQLLADANVSNGANSSAPTAVSTAGKSISSSLDSPERFIFLAISNFIFFCSGGSGLAATDIGRRTSKWVASNGTTFILVPDGENRYVSNEVDTSEDIRDKVVPCAVAHLISSRSSFEVSQDGAPPHEEKCFTLHLAGHFVCTVEHQNFDCQLIDSLSSKAVIQAIAADFHGLCCLTTVTGWEKTPVNWPYHCKMVLRIGGLLKAILEHRPADHE